MHEQNESVLLVSPISYGPSSSIECMSNAGAHLSFMKWTFFQGGFGLKSEKKSCMNK